MQEERIASHPNIEAIPTSLAEYLDADAATAAINKYGTRQKPASLFRSAWNHAEYAIAMGVNGKSVISSTYFDYANELSALVMHHPDVHHNDKLGALVLSSYMPALIKRSRREAIHSADCRAIYQSLGYAIEFLRPLAIDEPPQWAMAETAVLALSARISQPELLLYPTSPREETSMVRRFNHDSYFFIDDNKIPIQQKMIHTQKEYDDWITLLTLQPLMEKGRRRTKFHNQTTSLSDQVNALMSCLVAETHGITLNRSETEYLNFLSQAVAAHRFRGQAHQAA